MPASALASFSLPHLRSFFSPHCGNTPLVKRDDEELSRCAKTTRVPLAIPTVRVTRSIFSHGSDPYTAKPVGMEHSSRGLSTTSFTCLARFSVKSNRPPLSTIKEERKRNFEASYFTPYRADALSFTTLVERGLFEIARQPAILTVSATSIIRTTLFFAVVLYDHDRVRILSR